MNCDIAEERDRLRVEWVAERLGVTGLVDQIEALTTELAEARKIMALTKEELGDWGDGQEPHTHYCPNCDNSIDRGRAIRKAIDAAMRAAEEEK